MTRPGPALGDKTEYGTVVAVGMKDGERFYMAIDKHKCVTLMPVYEDTAHRPESQRASPYSVRDTGEAVA